MLGNENIKLAIIGNKMDLLTNQEQKNPHLSPIVQEAMQLTNELINARHYLTSAKLNQGIGDMFISLSRRMIEQSKRQQQLRQASNSLVSLRSRRTLSVTDNPVDENPGNNVTFGRGSFCCVGGKSSAESNWRHNS